LGELVNELISCISSSPQKVKTVFIGQRFTAVQLKSRDVGIALTPPRVFDSCIGMSKLSGSFTKYNTTELAKFCTGGNSFLKAMGWAAINAVLQKNLKQRSDYLKGDFLDILKIQKEDTVAMIDYYTTKIGRLKRANLMIFDDRFAEKRRDVQMFPMSSLPEMLPEADVVIIPPTMLDKIDEIRRMASGARDFVVVHPTTPPLPESFFKRGVTLVATMMILDADSLIRYVMEGAGTALFKKFCEKIAFSSRCKD